MPCPAATDIVGYVFSLGDAGYGFRLAACRHTCGFQVTRDLMHVHSRVKGGEDVANNAGLFLYNAQPRMSFAALFLKSVLVNRATAQPCGRYAIAASQLL